MCTIIIMNYHDLGESPSVVYPKEGLWKNKLGYEQDLHAIISDTNGELWDFDGIYDFKLDIWDIINDIRDNWEAMDADYKIKVLQNLWYNLDTATSLHGEDVWFEDIKDELIAFSKKPSTNEYEVDELLAKAAGHIEKHTPVE